MHDTTPIRSTALPGGSSAEPPRRPKTGRRLTLATLCIAVLVAQLDSSVANLAVRPIGLYFHAGVGQLQWIVDSYNLVYAALLLTGGLLADLYGRRRIFMAGAGVFTAASLACAAAPSISALICGRALAGLGAALLLPASLAVIRVEWTDAGERAKTLGIWTACNGLAWGIGPTVGGLLIDHAGWRSIFFLAIPLGLAALVLAVPAIADSADPQGRHFDAPGQILGAAGLGCLALAAIESHSNPAVAVAAFAGAAIAILLFLKGEARRGDAALVPLDIFRRREFTGAAVATAGMTFGMYGLLFLLPLTWQSTGRLGPTAAGIALVPMALVFVLVSPFSGALTGRLGARTATGGGVALIAAGLLVTGLTAKARSLLPAEAGLMLTGLGMGLATGPLAGLAVGAVAAARSGTAAALVNVARMSGATVGVATLGALYALADGGPSGLRQALVVGGLIQFASAAVVWRAARP